MFLSRVFEDSTDFALSPERLDRAYREVESALYDGRTETVVIAPLLGFEIASPELALGEGLTLVQGDAFPEDAPADALWAPGAQRPHLLVVVRWEAAAGDTTPVAHARVRLRRLLTALRLYDGASVGFGPLAWTRTGGSPWQPFALGALGRRGEEPIAIAAHQEDELRAFCSLIVRRTPRSGELAWALRRYEMSCERAIPGEALTDVLLALRALIEPEGPASGRLAGRLGALCALPDDRAALTARVAHTIAPSARSSPAWRSTPSSMRWPPSWPAICAPCCATSSADTWTPICAASPRTSSGRTPGPSSPRSRSLRARPPTACTSAASTCASPTSPARRRSTTRSSARPCAISLELRQSDAPGPAPQRATGLFHTAFVYPTRGQLGAALLRIAQEQAPFTGASDHLVSEALYLDDLDALGIELYRDRPRDTWPPPDPGERVKLATLPLDLRALAAEAEGDATGVRIGHVHLKVADVDAATRFWTQEVGLELMTGWAGQAAFLAADGYHHHIGANTWYSRGADPEPPEGPGLDAVVLGGTGRSQELRTPDGLRVVLEP